jgi:hypothetical protein
MRKTKTPQRSRLIRKWDGTPVGEAEPQPTAQTEAQTTPPSRASHTLNHPELFFEMHHEDELSDTLEH